MPLEALPMRVRIGVTGHRKLDNPESVAHKVDNFIQQGLLDFFNDPDAVRDHLNDPNHKTRIALTLITPLAEGADRLVAKQILNHAGSRLEVILPMAKSDYLEDFGSAESRREFEELLARDPQPMALRDKALRMLVPEEKLASARQEAYQVVGEYIVEKCDLLMAIWDGKKSLGAGGTNDIINFARRRRCPMVIIFVDERRTKMYKGLGLSLQTRRG